MTRGERKEREWGTPRRGRGATQSRGQHTQHHTPPFNKTTMRTRRGTPTHRQGTPTHDGESITLPPFIHHATHHPLCHPAILDDPTHHHSEGGGERTEDTPPHEHHRHTLTTHTPHTRQGTLCDMTAVLASTAMGRVGHEPHHHTGQHSSSTHHRHSTHREGWTPSTHPLIYSHTVHVHTTNERS